MKTFCALLCGCITGMWVGFATGTAFERVYVEQWKAVSFGCVDELTDCRAEAYDCQSTKMWGYENGRNEPVVLARLAAGDEGPR